MKPWLFFLKTLVFLIVLWNCPGKAVTASSGAYLYDGTAAKIGTKMISIRDARFYASLIRVVEKEKDPVRSDSGDDLKKAVQKLSLEEMAHEEMKSFKFADLTTLETQKLFQEKTKGRKPVVLELLKKFSKTEAQVIERLKITWSVEKFLQKRVETLTPIITQDEVRQSFQLQKSRFAGKSFEEVQEELSRELRKERLRKAFEAWVLSLREKYNYTNYLDAG